MSKAYERGVTIFEPHCLPPIHFEKNLKWPGKGVKPEDWYWEQIKAGRISKEAAKLQGLWFLVDGSQKPNHDSGRQLYENDPLGPTLARLRQEGKIAVPSSYRHIPDASRFAVSWDEVTQHVNPAVAELLGVEVSQVRLPRAIEFNVLGNLFHPEWGETTTWEWFEDVFGGGRRLHGGYSVYGGLADVDHYWSDGRDDIGFRPLVVFPSKT